MGNYTLIMPSHAIQFKVKSSLHPIADRDYQQSG